MTLAGLIGAAGGPWSAVSGAPAWAAALVLFVAAAALLALLLLQRRHWRSEARHLVREVESLREGQSVRGGVAGGESALGPVTDAIHRLARDLESRNRDVARLQDRLEAVHDALHHSAVVTTDVDGDIRSFSAGATALLGWERDEVIGRASSMLFEENAYREFLPKLTRRSLREQGVNDRVVLLRRDGSGFPAQVSVRQLSDSKGGPVGFLVVAVDVSDHVQLEHELRDSERRYRSLVEGLSEGVIIVRGGRVLYANPAFGELTGRAPDRLVGTLLRDQVTTRDVLHVEEHLAAIEGRRVPHGELRCVLIGPDGSARSSVHISATPVEYDGGPAGLLLVRDETVERRIEAELRRNESQLDAVLEATSDGILLLAGDEAEGHVVMANAAVARLLDLEPDTVMGASEHELVRLLRRHGAGAEKVADLLEATSSGPARRSIAIGGKRGRALEISVMPLRNRHGDHLGRVLACRDLTEQHESRRKLQQHAEKLQLNKAMLEHAYGRLESVNQELRGRSEQLDQLNQELRKLDEMKSNLLGNVSHELQTPLVSIRGYTEMILKQRLGPITEEQRKGLGLALKNIDRLISMIDNLLVFTRSEPESLKLTQFTLRELIDDVVALLADKARDQGIVVTVELDDPGVSIEADRDRIQQVLINLLSNAIKFNRQGGFVRINARAGRPGFVLVQVEDNGVGIPADAIDRIFDRNYQVQREGADAPAGSGIGLAIVRDILRLHGCRIGVESQDGHGARFHFTLPRGAAADGAVPAQDDGALESEVEQALDERLVEPPPAAAPEPAPEVEPVPEVQQPVQEVLPVQHVEPDSNVAADETGESRESEPEETQRRPRFRIIRRDG
ncbi:MAG: PAS domain S-box protein [bacterium]|nr:PAS domain S-box protein [bacterium]